MNVNRQWVRATLAPTLLIALGHTGAQIAREFAQFVRDVGYIKGKDESLLEAFVRIVRLERQAGTLVAAQVAFDADDLTWHKEVDIILQTAWAGMLGPDAISQQLIDEAGGTTAMDERLVCVVGDAFDPEWYPTFERIDRAFQALGSGQRPCRLAFVLYDGPPNSSLAQLPCMQAPWQQGDLLDGVFLYPSHGPQRDILSPAMLAYMMAEAVWALIMTGFAWQDTFQDILRQLRPMPGSNGIERVGFLVSRQIMHPRAAILEIAAAEVARELMSHVLTEALPHQLVDHNAFADAVDQNMLLTAQQLLDNMKLDMQIDTVPENAIQHIGPKLELWETMWNALLHKERDDVPPPTEASLRLLSVAALSNVLASVRDEARTIIETFEEAQTNLSDDADAQHRIQVYHATLQSAAFQQWTHNIAAPWEEYHQTILRSIRLIVQTTLRYKGHAEALRIIEDLQEWLVGVANTERHRRRKLTTSLQEQLNQQTRQVKRKRRIALNEEEKYLERQPTNPDQALLDFGTDLGKKLAPRDKQKAGTAIIVTLVVTLSLAGTFISSDESSSVLHTLFPFLPVLPLLWIGRLAFSGLMRVSKMHQLLVRRRLFQKYKPVALLCEQFEQHEAIARNTFFSRLDGDLKALNKRYRQDWHELLQEAQAQLEARSQRRSMRYARQMRRTTDEIGLIARYDDVVPKESVAALAHEIAQKVLHRSSMKQAFWRHMQRAVGSADWIEQLSNGHLLRDAFAFALAECYSVQSDEGALPDSSYTAGLHCAAIERIHPLMHSGQRGSVPLRPQGIGVAVPLDRQHFLRLRLQREDHYTLIDSIYPHTIIVFATYLQNLVRH